MTQTNDTMLRAMTFVDKGGVGKTTSTAHLGVAAANASLDVLLIDLAGKQSDLAKHFGISPPGDDERLNIGTVFSSQWAGVRDLKPDAAEALIKSTEEGVDLIPAHHTLDGQDNNLASVNVEDRFVRLDEFLTKDIEPLGYDLVLLDAPGLTNNITLSGLYAAQHVVAPIELGEFERRQMGRLIEDLNELQEQTGREVELTMVLPNRVDTRTKLDRQLLEETREQYGKLVAPKHIPQSQDVRNSQAEGKTLFALEEPSKTATRAIEAYETDADSLIQRLVGDVDLPTLTAVANETANDN